MDRIAEALFSGCMYSYLSESCTVRLNAKTESRSLEDAGECECNLGREYKNVLEVEGMIGV